jgi:proline iminopeptidase
MAFTPPSAALYPPISPATTGYLDVGQGHRIYFEQFGALHGIPAVFLHGGPGSGCNAQHRQIFNPKLYRAVLFDQRACGRSQAQEPLTHNTTQDLVRDIEALRLHLGIERWLVVGGSWGAGLALAYASQHPAQCLGLLLRGVFLGREQDLHWFFQDMCQLLPDAWAELVSIFPSHAHQHLLKNLHEGLNSNEPERALACALAWQAWERSVTARARVVAEKTALHSPAAIELINKYQLQSHYLVNACFLANTPLLEAARTLPSSLPVGLVHGRLDWVCRPSSAWELHTNMSHSQLIWLDSCGHLLFEPAMAQTIVGLLDQFAQHQNFESP